MRVNEIKAYINTVDKDRTWSLSSTKVQVRRTVVKRIKNKHTSKYRIQSIPIIFATKLKFEAAKIMGTGKDNGYVLPYMESF